MDIIIENCNFKEIANLLPYAVVVTNRSGEVVWSNPSFYELCGYTNEELIGRKPGSILQGRETNPKTVQALHQAVEKGQAIKTEIINYHKKGDPYWASIAITPIRNKKNKVIGFIALEHDTTKKHERIKSLEEQVVELYSVLVSID